MEPSSEIEIRDRFSLVPLEYQTIIDKLARQTQSALGHKVAAELLPSSNVTEVAGRLDYSDDARSFFDRESTIPSFQGLQDCHDQLGRASKGGILSATELHKVNSTIKSIRSARRIIRDAEFEYVHITRDTQRIGLFPEVEEALDHAIHPEGEILDRASGELSRIRRELNVERERAERTLASMISNFSKKGFLRDANYTIKNGRYVLPFRQDCRKNVKAVVQARSTTGSTIFMEPYELVERNNRLSELKGEEEVEVQRILFELSALVGSRADEIRSSLNTTAFLDFVFACGRLSREWKGVRLDYSEKINIKKARHPLIPSNDVVPVDIEFPDKARALIISGPNAGGKTVALKTVGLFALLNQAGLHVPARDGSCLPVYGSIHADIGDLQSIEWNLSSFSAHIVLIKRMFTSLSDPDHRPGLVLLDEIGRSTDPQEGSALSLAIIEKLLEIDTWIAVTTHLPAIKNLVLANDSRVAGASVEFDIENAEPLYTIKTGTLGASYAIAIAKRLGMDAAVLDRANDLLVQDNDILSVDMPGLEHRIDELEADLKYFRDEADKARRELKSVIALERLVLISAFENAEKIANVAEKHLKKAKKVADQLPHKIEKEEISDGLKNITAWGEKIRRSADLLSAPITARGDVSDTKKKKELGILETGKPVWVLSLRREAELYEIKGKRATVVIGNKRLTVPIDQIEPLRDEDVKVSKKKMGTMPSQKSLPLFIDLHGLTVDEAIEKLDPYLDEAFYQGRERAHVIHGFGTGRLRKGIHAWLGKLEIVNRFELADALQGGGGVTIIHLKKEKK